MPRMPVKPSVPRGAPRAAPKAASPAARKNLVWLASYPKSGNTWTRIFLANYIIGGETPVPINQVYRLGIGDSISAPYKALNRGVFDPGDHMGHLAQREKVMQGIAGNGAGLNFVKTHNANDTAFGTRLIDPALTRSAVYIIRDPRDVAISYARHYGGTASEACRSISRDDNTITPDKSNVMQFLGDWSEHVRGWTKGRGFPVHTMRYEDMKADAEGAFEKLLTVLGIPVDAEKLTRSVRFSSFDEVKKQEQKDGFIERSPKAESFFHSGTSGQWDGVLSAEDLAFMEKKHATQMKRFGYL